MTIRNLGTGEAAVANAALPFIVAATFFMEYLDTTIIATALPQMARSFSVGPNEVSLGMTAYMLTLAVFIPISGWIADRFGSRTVFGGALIIFTVASVLCGFSAGIASFTAARVLQGIGGAMMVPVGRMIVVRNTDKSRLMQAISTITWPAILAPVVGPTLGGFITSVQVYSALNGWVYSAGSKVGPRASSTARRNAIRSSSRMSAHAAAIISAWSIVISVTVKHVAVVPLLATKRAVQASSS
ncbi:MAG TPA: MFS transporter [Steroidobacteraceae bacterium]